MNCTELSGYATDDCRRSPSPTGRLYIPTADRRMSFGSPASTSADITGLPTGFCCYGNGRWSSLTRDGFRGSTSSLASISSTISLQPAARRESVIETLEKKRRESVSARLRNLQLQLSHMSDGEGCRPSSPEAVIDMPIIAGLPRRGRDSVLPRAPRRHSAAYQQQARNDGEVTAGRPEMTPLGETRICADQPASSVRRHSLSSSGLFGDSRSGTTRSLSVFCDAGDGEASPEVSPTSPIASSKGIQLSTVRPANKDDSAYRLSDGYSNGLSSALLSLPERLTTAKNTYQDIPPTTEKRNYLLDGKGLLHSDAEARVPSTPPETAQFQDGQNEPASSTCDADSDRSTELRHHYYRKFSDNEDEYEPAATTTESIASCDDISVDSFTYHPPTSESDPQLQQQRTSPYLSSSPVHMSLINASNSNSPGISSSDSSNFRLKRPTSLSAANLYNGNGIATSMSNAILSPLESGDRAHVRNNDRNVWSHSDDCLRAAVSYPSVAMATGSQSPVRAKSTMLSENAVDDESGKQNKTMVKYRSAIALSLSTPSSATSSGMGNQSTSFDGNADTSRKKLTLDAVDSPSKTSQLAPAATVNAAQQRHVSELRIPTSKRTGVSRSGSHSSPTASSSTSSLFCDALVTTTDDVGTGRNGFRKFDSQNNYDKGNENDTSRTLPLPMTSQLSTSASITRRPVSTSSVSEESAPPLPSQPPPMNAGVGVVDLQLARSSDKESRQTRSVDGASGCHSWPTTDESSRRRRESSDEGSTTIGRISTICMAPSPEVKSERRISAEENGNDYGHVMSSTWRSRFTGPGDGNQTIEGQSSAGNVEMTTENSDVEQQDLALFQPECPRPRPMSGRSQMSSVQKLCSQLIKVTPSNRTANEPTNDGSQRGPQSPLSTTHRKPPMFVRLTDDKKPANGSKTQLDSSPSSPLKNSDSVAANMQTDATRFRSTANHVETVVNGKELVPEKPASMHINQIETLNNDDQRWSKRMTSSESPTKQTTNGSGTDALFSHMRRTAGHSPDEHVDLRWHGGGRGLGGASRAPYCSIPATSVEWIPGEVRTREKIIVPSAGAFTQRVSSSGSTASTVGGSATPFCDPRRETTSEVVRIIPIVVNKSTHQQQETQQVPCDNVSGAATARPKLDLSNKNGVKVIEGNHKSTVVRRSRDVPDECATDDDVSGTAPNTHASWSSVTLINESVFTPTTSINGNSQSASIDGEPCTRQQIASKSTASRSSMFASTVGGNGIRNPPNEAVSVDRSWESCAVSAEPRATATVRPRSACDRTTTPSRPDVGKNESPLMTRLNNGGSGSVGVMQVSGYMTPAPASSHVILTPVSVQHETTIAVRNAHNGNSVKSTVTSSTSDIHRVPINGNRSNQSFNRSTSGTSNDSSHVILTNELSENNVSSARGMCIDINNVIDNRQRSRLMKLDGDNDIQMADTFELDVIKSGLGLSFCIEGGKDSSAGDRPITVKRVFRASEQLWPGDQILKANGRPLSMLSHYVAWNYLKSLPEGSIRLVVRRPGAVTGVVSP